MAKEVRLTTSGTPTSVVLPDLGNRTFTHPISNFNLLTEFSEDELQESVDLQAAVTGGDVTLTDENGKSLTVVADIGPHTHFIQDVAAFTLTEFNTQLSGADVDATGTARPPTVHATTHVKDGSDEIDGDHLDIDFSPANYTPNTTPTEASDLDHLAAHLSGIDTALGGVPGNETFQVTGARSKNNVSNIYLDGVDGIPSNLSGVVIPFACTLNAVSASTDGNETWVGEIRRNGSPTVIASVTIAGAAKGKTTGLSVAIAADDLIEFYCNGSGISYPTLTAWFTRE